MENIKVALPDLNPRVTGILAIHKVGEQSGCPRHDAWDDDKRLFEVGHRQRWLDKSYHNKQRQWLCSTRRPAQKAAYILGQLLSYRKEGRPAKLDNGTLPVSQLRNLCVDRDERTLI